MGEIVLLAIITYLAEKRTSEEIFDGYLSSEDECDDNKPSKR